MSSHTREERIGLTAWKYVPPGVTVAAPPAGLTVEERGRLNGTIDALRDQLRDTQALLRDTQALLAQWQRNAELASLERGA